MVYHSSELPLIENADNLSIDEMSLCAAWFLNIKFGEKIPKDELAFFIQTHIKNLSHEEINDNFIKRVHKQRKTQYWDCVSYISGPFTLNQIGYERMHQLFGKINRSKFCKGKIRPSTYVFSRSFQGNYRAIFRENVVSCIYRHDSLIHYIINGETGLSLNDNLGKLYNLGIDIDDRNSFYSILEWIVQDNDYYYEIFYD